jgi:hypothetical protein
MKLSRARETIKAMIEIYCYAKHGCKDENLCDECERLLTYANLRLDRCPFGDEKPFCSTCSVHCYNKQMRERIKEVMRFAGVKILFHHPILAFWHLVGTIKSGKTREN